MAELANPAGDQDKKILEGRKVPDLDHCPKDPFEVGLEIAVEKSAGIESFILESREKPLTVIWKGSKTPEFVSRKGPERKDGVSSCERLGIRGGKGRWMAPRQDERSSPRSRSTMPCRVERRIGSRWISSRMTPLAPSPARNPRGRSRRRSGSSRESQAYSGKTDRARGGFPAWRGPRIVTTGYSLADARSSPSISRRIMMSRIEKK